MIPAYDRMYLADAEDCLAAACDYAVNDCGLDADLFSHAFMSSGLAHLFERGNPSVVSGMSGIELATRAIQSCGLPVTKTEQTYACTLSPEYWGGWVVAQYQWSTACSFSTLFSITPLSRVISLYHPLHEADISSVMERIDALMESSRPRSTALATMRKHRGLSQSELSRMTGVGLKSIQAYEQRVNDLAKASAETVVRMARTLGCSAEELLGTVPHIDIEYGSGNVENCPRKDAVAATSPSMSGETSP